MIADLPLYKDATTFFGKTGSVYSPTLIVAGVPHGSMEYFRPRANLLEEARTRRFMPYPMLAAKVAAVCRADVVRPRSAERPGWDSASH